MVENRKTNSKERMKGKKGGKEGRKGGRESGSQEEKMLNLKGKENQSNCKLLEARK